MKKCRKERMLKMKNKSVISVVVDTDIKEALQAVAESNGVFLSDVIRESVGWENAEIKPNSLAGKRDKDLVLAMAVSELFPNTVIDFCKESIKHTKSDSKKKTLEWIKKRYHWIYENMKAVNYQMLEVLDQEYINDNSQIVEDFTRFLQHAKKTKTNLNRFHKVCWEKK